MEGGRGDGGGPRRCAVSIRRLDGVGSRGPWEQPDTSVPVRHVKRRTRRLLSCCRAWARGRSHHLGLLVQWRGVACTPHGQELSTVNPELQVIALVASAGGLEAVSRVLQGLPDRLDAAVVVLIHQAPDRESALVQLLGRRSRLTVTAAQDGTPLHAGAVVVAPPVSTCSSPAGPASR